MEPISDSFIMLSVFDFDNNLGYIYFKKTMIAFWSEKIFRNSLEKLAELKLSEKKIFLK
jgi:hypothetical protein